MLKKPDISFLFEPSSDGLQAVSVSAAANAASNTAQMVDTSGGAFTITLPAAPATGDVIEIVDATGDFDTNTLTVNGNGKNIEGVATKDFSGEYQYARFVYTGAQWVVQQESEGPPAIYQLGASWGTLDYYDHTSANMYAHVDAAVAPGQVAKAVVYDSAGDLVHSQDFNAWSDDSAAWTDNEVFTSGGVSEAIVIMDWSANPGAGAPYKLAMYHDTDIIKRYAWSGPTNPCKLTQVVKPTAAVTLSNPNDSIVDLGIRQDWWDMNDTIPWRGVTINSVLNQQSTAYSLVLSANTIFGRFGPTAGSTVPGASITGNNNKCWLDLGTYTPNVAAVRTSDILGTFGGVTASVRAGTGLDNINAVVHGFFGLKYFGTNAGFTTNINLEVHQGAVPGGAAGIAGQSAVPAGDSRRDSGSWSNFFSGIDWNGSSPPTFNVTKLKVSDLGTYPVSNRTFYILPQGAPDGTGQDAMLAQMGTDSGPAAGGGTFTIDANGGNNPTPAGAGATGAAALAGNGYTVLTN